MATTHSDDSTTAEPRGSIFASDRVVTSFPWHEVVKLDESSFIQWQQQVRFILRGYGLLGFLDGSFTAPTRFIRSTDGTLVSNPSALVFEQQDNLLTSWLLSTISSSFLSSFTDVRTTCDVWTMANSIFAADTSVKQSQLRHDLHSLKKASGVQISETERTAVLLAGLSSEFDAVVSSVSLSPVLLPFQRVVDTLLECEARQARSVQDVLIFANLVEGSQLHDVDGSSRGGRPPLRGRGRGFRPRVQCQICSRYGHLAQRCYYWYYRDETSTEVPMVQHGGPVFGAVNDDWGTGFRSQNGPGQRPGQNWVASGQNWMPSNVYVRPKVGASNVDPRGPHAATNSLGPNPFVAPGARPPTDGFYSAYGHQSLAQRYGDIGGLPIRPYGPNGTGQGCGPSGSVRPRINDGQISSQANVNCVNLDGPLQNTAPAVPWRTKPRARVFDVDSSPYDSSQFVGIPRLPELHASDYSDATAYDSNWDGTGSWCPDTGATHHVCQNASELNTSTPYSGNSSLLMGNGAPTRISSIGHTVLPTPNKVLHLSNVLCVPSIRKNLMLVSQFASDNNVFFEFHPLYCVIKDAQTHEVLMRGRVRDGLYQFTVAKSVHPASVPSVHNAEVLSSSSNNNVFELWHKRLGHPSDVVVKDVLNKSNVAFSKKCLGSVCVACQQDKAHKLPFISSTTEYLELFELVVSDLWGPASVACEGNLYYVSFIDMCSRFTWVYLIKRKSQALECFLQFQKMVLTQFGKHIKKFQSDWGGEFRAFASVLANHGILHRLSCPHTSEQNGVAERKHRHIVETGLTLLAQSNLPMMYWGYAFCSAVHLINRLPTPVLQGQSPYQVLYGKEPTYDHLRVFGCCCFPYLRPFLSHKLDFRSQPCTFLGYSSQHKGYYCLTPDGKMIISRHVVFDEQRFPFSSAVKDTDSASGCVPTYVPIVRSAVVQPLVRQSSTPSSEPSPSLPGEPSASCTPTLSGSVDVSSGGCPSCPSALVPAGPVSLGNTHTMVTRSKAGIFKPRVLHVETDEFEPRTVEEALAHTEWKQAVQAEFDALVDNSTWCLVPLPPGRKVIGCKWLFKVKKNPDGTIARRKARLVAKGCSQAPGCDFKETFSPVVKPATIRVILSVAVTKGWKLRQVDVNNAFLNGDLTDEVFMQQPPGYVQSGQNGERLVCRLNKALYGLRQAPRAWFDKLKGFLTSAGFVLSKSDASLFVRITTTSTLYVLVYVDDIIITGNESGSIDDFVQQLHSKFSLKDMGDLHYFLGVEVTRMPTGSLHLCQRKYISDILDRSGLANAKSVNTPMVSSSILSKSDGDFLSDPTDYRSLAGALQYVVLTRPDIAYAVNRVCQFMHAPTTEHLTALKRILRYLRGTIDYGLIFRPSDRLSLVGYADANWGLDFDDRRSTTGYCIFFGHTPVSWSSKKQQVVSRSTAEAEYRSLAAAASDVTWLMSLLQELHLCSVDVLALWCDNSSAVAVAANPVLHSKFKHVELDLFFVREKVATGSLVVGEVPACDQVADVLTKPLSASVFTRFRNFLRVYSREEMGEC
ncbi:hypothetical protein CXB51_006097 [Gossypium anomalum]|uniref:Integrase catalytic domain-containing protein n=1 Tax=Gossypium anomalum TaxID=47600 RepID=A0A8J5ZIV0_9ROSI|nr:hypothetical protein CXB51_006097 [Gossypium anomalum]